MTNILIVQKNSYFFLLAKI